MEKKGRSTAATAAMTTDHSKRMQMMTVRARIQDM
jgi:hypothetical protein